MTVHHAHAGDEWMTCGKRAFDVNFDVNMGPDGWTDQWVDVTCLKCMSIGVPIALENRRRPQLGLVDPKPPKVKGLDFAVMVEDKWVESKGISNVRMNSIAYPNYLTESILDEIRKPISSSMKNILRGYEV